MLNYRSYEQNLAGRELTAKFCLKDAVIKKRFCTKILHCHIGVLIKKFRGGTLEKAGPRFFKKPFFIFLNAW